MRRVIWAESATQDLHQIKSYLIENYDSVVAEKTIATLILSAHWLLDYPQAGSLIGKDHWRKWRPRKTRHILLYRPHAQGIKVLRVRHERNDWRPVPQD